MSALKKSAAKKSRAVAAPLAAEPRTVLPGSTRPAFRGKKTPLSPRTRVTVSVIVCRKQTLQPAAINGQHITRAQYRSAHSASPDALKAVKAFAKQFGLTANADPIRRTVEVSGSANAMQQAFGVTLHECKNKTGTYRVREGEITLPDSLTSHVEAVLGLDNRPIATPHFRVARARAVSASFTPLQLAQIYGFPAGAKATGQTIGILEFGGGYRTADITAYFKSLGITAPTVTAVSVDKGKNTPGDANGADGEVMLDIEIAAAVAPGAKIAVYFAPNTDQGFVDAITTAVHDTKNKPSVLSISWGGPESTWTAQARTALDSACQSAAALGITITVAAGDNGSDDGVGDNANHVDFPASSPNVLACGGTKLVANGNTIASEVVWNETSSNEGATGGGISTAFPQPSYQSAIAATRFGRGVPDVAGDADPTTGYQVRVDGQNLVVGGTSAVAPLWAGLIALANAQNKTTAGLIQPRLYTAAGQKALHDITSGNNGAFKAATGWDACTGLGTPNGAAIIALLATGSATRKGAAKGAGRKASKATSV